MLGAFDFGSVCGAYPLLRWHAADIVFEQRPIVCWKVGCFLVLRTQAKTDVCGYAAIIKAQLRRCSTFRCLLLFPHFLTENIQSIG